MCNLQIPRLSKLRYEERFQKSKSKKPKSPPKRVFERLTMARFSRGAVFVLVLVLVAGLASAQEETVADAPQETQSDGVGMAAADSTTGTLNSILEESADETTAASSDDVSTAASNQEDAKAEEAPPTSSGEQQEEGEPVQTGPLIDIFGPKLLSLEMIDESSAELRPHLTSDALRGKKVIGVYFSADWCKSWACTKKHSWSSSVAHTTSSLWCRDWIRPRFGLQKCAKVA